MVSPATPSVSAAASSTAAALPTTTASIHRVKTPAEYLLDKVRKVAQAALVGLVVAMVLAYTPLSFLCFTIVVISAGILAICLAVAVILQFRIYKEGKARESARAAAAPPHVTVSSPSSGITR